MKGELFKLELLQETHVVRNDYESNDGRSNRYTEHVSYSYRARLNPVVPKEKWVSRYFKTEIELDDTLYSVVRQLRFMGVKDKDIPSLKELIPSIVIPEWELGDGRIMDISKKVYDILLSSTHKEKRMGYMHSKEGDVAFFYLHSGIKGLHLQLIAQPGVERHPRKRYFDKFVETSEDLERADDAVLEQMAIMLERAFPKPYNWDYRYMPDNSSKGVADGSSGTSLGDLLKDVGL